MTANQRALIGDHPLRDVALADTLQQINDWEGKFSPMYAAAFQCVLSSIGPDWVGARFTQAEWYAAIISGRNLREVA